jgi:hypothetical protein
MAWLDEEPPVQPDATAFRSPLCQGPDRRGSGRPPPRPHQRVLRRLSRYHLAAFPRPKRGDARATEPLPRASRRPRPEDPVRRHRRRWPGLIKAGIGALLPPRQRPIAGPPPRCTRRLREADHQRSINHLGDSFQLAIEARTRPLKPLLQVALIDPTLIERCIAFRRARVSQTTHHDEAPCGARKRTRCRCCSRRSAGLSATGDAALRKSCRPDCPPLLT